MIGDRRVRSCSLGRSVARQALGRLGRVSRGHYGGHCGWKGFGDHASLVCIVVNFMYRSQLGTANGICHQVVYDLYRVDMHVNSLYTENGIVGSQNFVSSHFSHRTIVPFVFAFLRLTRMS